MSFTKGPWSVWTTMDNTLCIHAMEAPRSPVVADVSPIGARKHVAFPGQSEYDAPNDTPSDEEIANAHLILAAPDLYEACLSALFPAGDTEEEVRAQLRAALAKAQGREVQP